MGLDLTNDYNKAKTKINAYQTVVENKKNDAQQKKQKATTSLDKKKSDVIKQLNELDKGTNELKNQIKNELKNQLEQLLDLFKQTLPQVGEVHYQLLVDFFYKQRKKQKNK